MHLNILAATTLASLASLTLTNAQALTPPSCKQDDLPCYVASAQYTVLGTVVSTNSNASPGTPSNYNATISIQCVYASYNTTLNTGANILGKNVLVTRFGQPRSQCPNGGGATATPSQTAIFFVHVANTPAHDTTPILSVFDICTGGVPNTDTSRQQIGTVLAKNPDYGFYGASRGGANCTLPGLPTEAKPTPSPSPSVTSATPTATATGTSQSAAKNNKAGWGFTGLVALVLGAIAA
ncbi:hypothetical protein HK097_003012 [Rhizophlyctis rosea]|uniref:Uncharacterized protein n=1 Tax=Rhizophlyctis rosea TaxID=64517 RepID=A0AAD5SGJ8_9FUNG|nr:hypothetical protein HK097_003012 [Rhizophlyctis rosea]